MGWGNNDYAQATAPAGNDFSKITAGYYHNVGLRTDGSLCGWGLNDYGQAQPPPGNDYTAIAAGGYHNLALKADGSIVGWGCNSDTWGNWYGQAIPPLGNDYIAVAAGMFHSLALKADGSIVGWGANEEGQATPPAGTGFIAIAAGRYHSLALKADGSIIGWGNNDSGQVAPPTGTGFKAIAAGSAHSVALKVNSLIESVRIDVKPGDCGNLLNVKSKGHLQVAVLGSSLFDVSRVDPASVGINGIVPVLCENGDVAGLPLDTETCPAGPDGLVDLLLYFEIEDVINSLGEVIDGQVIQVKLSGIRDGSRFEGQDFITIRAKEPPSKDRGTGKKK